jgi:hypothetical protein
MFDQKKISAIPGMIEPIEQKTLYELMSQLRLEPNDQIVEFGSFFGRSTVCIAQGLIDNPSRHQSNKVHAFDSFGCAIAGGFAPYVEEFSRIGGVSGLLSNNDGKLDFSPIFEHYLSEYIKQGLVYPVKAEIDESVPEDLRQIVFMHIDSPKHYEELRVVVERFFPLLKSGAIIVFQDYFYHWSATLIAAVEAMRQMNFLAYHFSAASSLITQIRSESTANLVITIDELMADKTGVINLINDAVNACKSIQIDRPEAFVPRLWLASYQYLWEQGKNREATDLVLNYFSGGGEANQYVLNDYLEMMRAGFSIRALYEADHPK